LPTRRTRTGTPYVQDLGRSSIHLRLHGAKAISVHRLAGDEQLLGSHPRRREHEPLDVLAVYDDRVGAAIDRFGQRPAEAMKAGVRMHPHPGPEHERHSGRAGGTVGEGQHQPPVEALDDGVVAPRAQRERDSRHHRLTGDPVPATLDPAEVPVAHERNAPVPVALALVGEEVEVGVEAPGQFLVQSPPVVGGEVIDERDAAPGHQRATS
jgi:hypothetical protein